MQFVPKALQFLMCLVATAILIFPWVNPVASGPSPSVFPWLMATACSVLLWTLRAQLSSRRIAETWLLAALVSSVLGLLQYFGKTEPLGGLVHVAGLGDAFANLRQRNQFATLTSIGLIATLWFASEHTKLSSERRTKSSNLWAMALPVLLLLALGNASSSSRTGLLQWCLLLGLFVLWGAKGNYRIAALCAVALFLYVLAVLMLPWLLELLTGTSRGGLLARFAEEPGCRSRRVLWSNVLHLIAQKPWTGWGWGELDYAHFVTLYPGERFCDILDNAHNLPLHLAVELGVPAAIASIGMFVLWVLRNQPWAEQNPTRQMAWAVLAVISLHSLLEYPLWYGPFQQAVALCVFLLWRMHSSHSAEKAAGEPPTWRKSRASMALQWIAASALMALLAVASWDYWRVSQLYLQTADRSVGYRDNTLDRVRDSWFFQDQVQFAALTTAPLNRGNAIDHNSIALQQMHFSPEPRVIEVVIESAVLLGKDQEAQYYLQRYEAAFPDAYATWIARSARFIAP